jgi:DNA-binding XRE family transcriptional regulator
MEKLRGAPTLFDKSITQTMIDFFKSWPEYVVFEKEVASGGRKILIKERTPNLPPTLNKFAKSIGVHRNTLINWTKIDEDFLCAYEYCKMIQEEFLSDKGLLGEYNPAITKLMLINHSNIKDKVIHEISDSSKVLIQITEKENEL